MTGVDLSHVVLSQMAVGFLFARVQGHSGHHLNPDREMVASEDVIIIF